MHQLQRRRLPASNVAGRGSRTPPPRSLLSLVAAGLFLSACVTAVTPATPKTVVGPPATISTAVAYALVPAPRLALGGAEMSTSCVRGPACTEIGWNHRGDAGYLWVARWEHHRWNALSAPPNTGVPGAGGQLTLSCATAQWCMATGSTIRNHLGTSAPYSAVLDGHTWTMHTVPVPSGSSDFTLTQLACRTATWCMATGEYVASKPNYSDEQFLLAEVWNGTAWRAVHIDSPRTDAHQLDPGFFDGGEHPTAALQQLSCASISFCVVTGFWNGGFAEQWNGKRWTTAHPPDAPGYPASASEFSGGTCSTTSFCLAVGGYSIANGIFSPLVDEWGGTRWTEVELPRNPRGINYGGGFRMVTVTCTTARHCLSFGLGGTTSLGRVGLVWNGSHWNYVRVGTLASGDLVCLSPRICS